MLLQKGDFSTLLDSTLVDIALLNANTFSVTTSGKSKVNIFFPLTTFITDTQKRDDFAKSLMNNVASFNFENVFTEKYDFFSSIFEYLLKDLTMQVEANMPNTTPHMLLHK